MAIDVISSALPITSSNCACGLPHADKFEELVLAMKKALGPSSGLTSDDVDVSLLTKLMKNYYSNPMEWGKYAFGDASRGYTRNLVDEGNGKSNLLVLVWSPGKGSPIHDHGNAHCLMKILHGSLTETRYAFPDVDAEPGPMEIISEKTYEKNGVTYMADELGLHRVSNRGSDFAVSLHLYTPPNVAKEGCHIFDERTGKSSHVPGCNYYSAYGRLLKQ
ncbi:hypothetical protein E4U43_005407 [Claviceps pusilla]|uniref:Cysteine dioxygenase n=1 Tax=Claviceps pusilla TaxID=123648 RepID=A0A9P7NEG0_9HYPO|nr:hypothetical protein E4U43_005407 [Claviceps pusilla]